MTESIEHRVKAHLLAGNSLTVIDGLNLFKTIDLRKTISTLRREGMLIDDEWIHNQNSKKKFKKYFLRKPKTVTELNSVQNKILFHEDN